MTAAAGPADVYVSAGSNLEPERHLRAAVAALRARYGALRLSPVYRSAPVGYRGPDFLNLVIALRCHESPEDLVAFMEGLHRRAGRGRGAPRNAHTLDLDLLLYGDLVRDGEGIRLPREDITRYAFVLAPLADLAPTLRHPVSGRSMRELWRDFDAASQPLTRVDIDLG